MQQYVTYLHACKACTKHWRTNILLWVRNYLWVIMQYHLRPVILNILYTFLSNGGLLKCSFFFMFFIFIWILVIYFNLYTIFVLSNLNWFRYKLDILNVVYKYILLIYFVTLTSWSLRRGTVFTIKVSYFMPLRPMTCASV